MLVRVFHIIKYDEAEKKIQKEIDYLKQQNYKIKSVQYSISSHGAGVIIVYSKAPLKILKGKMQLAKEKFSRIKRNIYIKIINVFSKRRVVTRFDKEAIVSAISSYSILGLDFTIAFSDRDYIFKVSFSKKGKVLLKCDHNGKTYVRACSEHWDIREFMEELEKQERRDKI